MGELRFTEAKRARFLALVEAGRSLADAAQAVPISEDNIYRWLRAGRREQATEKADFAAAYDRLKAAPTTTRMTEGDLVNILEVQARKGSVPATKLLLTKPWAKQAEKPKPEPKPHTIIDQLALRRRAWP